MDIFKSRYTIISSSNEQISSLWLPFFILGLFSLLFSKIFPLICFGIALLLFIPYRKGLGEVFIQDNDGTLHLESNGANPLQGTIKSIRYGWSYRFIPKGNIEVYHWMSPWFMNRWQSSSSSRRNAPSNTNVLNIILELDNGETVVIHQQLNPWSEIPSGWKYVGKEILHYSHFLRVRGGLKKLRKQLSPNE